MKKNVFIAAALSAVLTLGVGSVAAQGYGQGGYGGPGMGQGMGPGMGQGMGPGMGQGMGGGMPGPLAALNLTEEQQKAIQELMQKQRQERMGDMQKMAELGQKLQEQYSKAQWDANAIMGVYDQMFSMQKDNIKAGIAVHNQVMEVLNEEQRQQLQQMMQHRGGPGMGRGPGMGPGMMGGPGMGRGYPGQ